MPAQSLKIVNASYIITMRPDRAILRNGAILVEGNRIVYVGPSADVAGRGADRVIDASNMVVTPGFVNGHDHLYGQIMRGMLLDELSPNYVEEAVALRGTMTEEDEYTSVRACITEHLKYGTTTVLNPGDSPLCDAHFEAYKNTGIRAIMGKNVTDRPNLIQLEIQSTEAALAEIRHTMELYHGGNGGRVNCWPMLAYATTDCSSELALGAKRLADEYGVGMTFHQSARKKHIDQCLQEHGVRPIEYLEQIGVVGPNVLLAHAVRVDDNEVDILARTETRVVMCPVSSLRAGFGTTVHGKLPEMLKKGVVVGVGNDSAEFGISDTLQAVFLVAGLYKDARENTSMIQAESALEMATINGAKALGLDYDIGSIEQGKKADLVLFDANRPEWRPLYNPVSNLVYNAGSRSVHTVIVDGEVLVEAGVATFIDERKLLADLQASGEAMLARINHKVPQRWPVLS